MKFFAAPLIAIIALSSSYFTSASAATVKGSADHDSQKHRTLRKGRGGSKRSSSSSDNKTKTLTLTIINESFNQPFGGFFVMVHKSNAAPLYRRGQPSSEPLAVLAEDGNSGPLVELYTNGAGVASVFPFAEGAPYFGGETFQIQVKVSDAYPLVTIATMAINTNDCFTSINGARLNPGMVLDLPGLDAGSEENNELCNLIPGPGCASINATNFRSGNGEGFVHVHRGFFGIGHLPGDRYNWRNPMMRVVVN